ncbi:MAG: hypothetical protein HKO64_05120 [Xanthomonadales bacterium]|nr:hypothetical protein [Xanthomonadales bacterium]NNL94981.1 hypothetical protein [Xanthomonadales bacterium]
MNRKNLTAAVLAGLAGAAGIAGTAQAVNLNPDGLGQVLIYPYYTINGGNATLLSVVNTSEDAKAVKVRFLEGQNSKEVLDFNLYMSAYDVWVAAIVDGGTIDLDCNIDNGLYDNQCGVPHLVIEDTTCTVPYLFEAASTAPGVQAFLTFGLNDEGPDDISRTTEGHFEMIEMGTLVGSSADAATHSGGTPSDCQQLVDAWTQGPDDFFGSPDDGYWIYSAEEGNPALTDIEDPSGGLFGGASIVNGQAGTMYSYDAIAINGFSEDRMGAEGSLHSFPGTELPSLNSGDQTTGYVFTQNGEVASDSFIRPVDAVSYVFMHDSMMNEYVTGGLTNGESEWVITFPTKNFYVNAEEGDNAPFVSTWGDTGEGVYGACEPVFLDTIWDQEEATPTEEPGDDRPPIVSPAPPDPDPDPSVPFELCWETSVIRFGSDPGDTTEILGSSLFTNIDNEELDFEAGWARIDLVEYPVDELPAPDGNGVFDGTRFRDYLGFDTGADPDGDHQLGLPVTGFWVFKANNNYLFNDANEQVLANYGGLFNHKYTRCFGGEGSTCGRDED